MKTYPAVLLMARRGRQIAVAAGAVVAALGVGTGIAGGGWGWIVAGIVVGAVTWAAIRLVGELVEVVAETLLPR